MIKKKTIFLIIILVLTILFLFIRKGKNYQVVLKEEGFVPAEMTIEQGDSVTFITDRDKTFWPASDLHPMHDLYPEFDPKKPVEPKNSWTFTFGKKGAWKYHDHLFPYYRATMIVKEKSFKLLGNTLAPVKKDDEIISELMKSNECKGLEINRKTQCWEEKTIAVIDKYGIGTALRLVAALYDSDPNFANPCHSLMHLIGQNAYKLFSQHKDFEVAPQTAYCAFGFYHGFMEALVSKSGDPKQARQFCDKVADQLAKKVPDAQYACYHGIGHGWTNVHDEKLWGNERAMVNPALALCEKVAGDRQQLMRCATGVFDSISIAYYNKSYGLTMKKDDPLWLCREQPDQYKESCYRDMMPAILWLGDHDLVKSAPLVEKYAEKDYANIAIRSLAGDSMRFVVNISDPIKYLPVCRNLRQELRTPCIQGLGEGVMQFGPPEREYQDALKFCEKNELNDSEKVVCTDAVVGYVRSRYDNQKVMDICAGLKKQFKNNCPKI